MKKQQKYLPYVLAPLLIVIWGMVFKQVREQAKPAGFPSKPLRNFQASDTSFSFRLYLDYDDPFLKTTIQPIQTKKQSVKPKSPEPKVPVKPTPIPFPTCKFVGTIQSEGGKPKAMIRSNNGTLYQLAAGQEFMQWTIARFDSDSLLLILGKQQKWIKR